MAPGIFKTAIDFFFAWKALEEKENVKEVVSVPGSPSSGFATCFISSVVARMIKHILPLLGTRYVVYVSSI